MPSIPARQHQNVHSITQILALPENPKYNSFLMVQRRELQPHTTDPHVPRTTIALVVACVTVFLILVGILSACIVRSYSGNQLVPKRFARKQCDVGVAEVSVARLAGFYVPEAGRNSAASRRSDQMRSDGLEIEGEKAEADEFAVKWHPSGLPENIHAVAGLAPAAKFA